MLLINLHQGVYSVPMMQYIFKDIKGLSAVRRLKDRLNRLHIDAGMCIREVSINVEFLRTALRATLVPTIYNLENNVLERVQEVRDLGIIIASDTNYPSYFHPTLPGQQIIGVAFEGCARTSVILKR